MNKILLTILTTSLSINLAAEQEEDKPFSNIQVEVNDNLKHKTDDYKPLAELSKLEQFAHQSLMSKLELLEVHQKFILRQNSTLIKFIETLEDEKDEEGKIDEQRLQEIIRQSHFPKVIEMRSFLEDMKDDLFIGYKIESLLDIIFKDDIKAVYNWFTLLENEILIDINNYEKADVSLPQYRFMLSMYSDLKNYQIYIVKLFPCMSPKVFKN